MTWRSISKLHNYNTSILILESCDHSIILLFILQYNNIKIYL